MPVAARTMKKGVEILHPKLGDTGEARQATDQLR
jgi:hypothetical protein